MRNSFFLSFPFFIPSLVPFFSQSFLSSSFLFNCYFSFAVPCCFFWSHHSQSHWWPLYVISVPCFQIKCCASCHKLYAQEPAQYAFGIYAYIVCSSLCYLEYHTHACAYTHTPILSLKDYTWITWVVTFTCLHLSWVIHGSNHFCQQIPVPLIHGFYHNNYYWIYICVVYARM